MPGEKEKRRSVSSGTRSIRYIRAANATDKLPVVNIAPLLDNDVVARRSVAKHMGKAAMDTGFLYIENHGVSEALVRQVYDYAETFFTLSFEEKLRYYIGDSPNHRGFVPVTEKGTYLDETGPRTYEAFDMSLDMTYEDYQQCGANPLAGPNVWPEISGFKECLTRYYDSMRRVGDALCRGFEIALELPDGFFSQHMRYPTSQLRLIHYIEQPKQKTKVDMGAHTDYECFTVLHTHQKGLQIINKKGKWIDAPPVEGAFAVNIGDLLEAWTNGKLVSTPHRVITDGNERYSIPFFMATDYDTEVSPIESLLGKEKAVEYTPFIAGEHLMAQLMRDFPYLKKRYLDGEITLQAGAPGPNPFERKITASESDEAESELD
ncbi:MAG: 2OG-Fe(II) oxygenase family protein [Pseudomonadota bacterium]